MVQERLTSTVANAVGARIVGGEFRPGDSMRLDELEAEFGVSRSVSREAVKILESLGLVRSRRRVGVIVQPMGEWNVMAPQVIQWQLQGPNRLAGLEWISQLRSAIEPTAAQLAASTATAEQCTQMGAAVAGMTASAVDGDLHAYLRHDIAFHTTLLSASGNPLFAAQMSVVESVLRCRTELMPFAPNPDAIDLHRAVGAAVASRRGGMAEHAMRDLLKEARQAMEDAAS